MMTFTRLRAVLHGACIGGGILALAIGVAINWTLPDPQAPVYGGSFYSLAGALLLAAWLPAQELVDWYEQRRLTGLRRAKRSED
jgi:hypothetical protein